MEGLAVRAVHGANASFLPSDIDRGQLSTSTASSSPGQKVSAAARGTRHRRRPATCSAKLIAKIYVERYFPPANKAAMVDLVANLRKAMALNLADLQWMTPGNAGSGTSQARRLQRQDRLPGQVRDLRRPADPRRTPLANALAAAEWQRSPRTSTIWASRSTGRVVHDAADGQRLLQPHAQRDRLPRRVPAAAVLQPQRRSGGELRRDRRDHRPRDRPRLRRPGRQIRRRRHSSRLVDAAGQGDVRGARRQACRAI